MVLPLICSSAPTAISRNTMKGASGEGMREKSGQMVSLNTWVRRAATVWGKA